MAKNDVKIPTYYLDATVLIDLIEHPESEEPAKTMAAVIADAKTGRFELVTSVLTIAEVFKGKEVLDGRGIDPETEARILKLWHPGTSPIRLVEVHELIARRALRALRDGLAKGYCKTKGADGIHMQTAHDEGANEFWTTEKAAKKWEQIFGFSVCGPHWEPLPTSPIVEIHQPDLFPGSSDI